MPFFVASVSNFLAHYDMMQKEPEFAASIRQLQSDKAQLYFLKKKKETGLSTCGVVFVTSFSRT